MKLKTPIIKSWDCTDHDPIDEWVPDDPSMVEFWCNVAIGIEGEKGADNFEVHVVTEAMLPQIEEKKYLLVVPYYEGWNQIIEALNTKIKEINELNWLAMSDKLSKMFHWEYEGYR